MEKKTIHKLLKLAVFTIVISYSVDKLVFYSLNKISDNVMSGQAIGKLNQFLSVKDSVNLLVFGNSRANHHIVVDQFDENAFNMGVNGVGIAYSSTLINTVKKNKKQVIIVHIDTKNFFTDTYDGSDVRSLKSKYNRNNEITSTLAKSGHISALQNFYYSMNYNGSIIGILKNYVKPKYNYKSYNGYDPLVVNKSKASTRDFILSNDISEKCTDSHKVNPIALSYLKNIKSFMKDSNDKQFIFVTSPIHNDACAIDNKILSDIMYENDFTFWDFTNYYKKSKEDTSLWKDKTHMSNLGAEDFTALLLSKYKSYIE